MNLIITDTNECVIPTKNNVIISQPDKAVHHCIGCFGCWVKTPGQCVLNDEFRDLGRKLSLCSQLIIISKCTYGGFSPFVKNILDRSISYVHPSFVMRSGQMHHKRRYDNKIQTSVYFYGDISQKEKSTAENLVHANALNFDYNVQKIEFIDNISELDGIL